MTSVVKNFVELNIEVIENNKWFLLFMEWYNNPYKDFPDTKQWDEFIEVLQLIHKDVLEITKKYREAVIITVTRATIDELKKNPSLFGTHISLRFLLMDLRSTLGLTEEDVLECIHEAAKEEHVSFNSAHDWFTWS